MFEKYIERVVENVIMNQFSDVREKMKKEFDSVLHDVTYRINQLRELQGLAERRIQTSDLNLATHMLDGYTFTNNSPSAGYVAWSDVNIVYKGVTYTITDGNSNKKYIWWDFSASPNNVLQGSDTKPALTQDDVLVGINDGGTFMNMMTAGKLVPGSALTDGSVGSNELGAGAVTNAKLAALAVTSDNLADGAVSEVKLGANAVTSGKIASGAVTSGTIASGAVGSTQLASGAVTSAKIANGAVGSSQIASGAVGSTQLGAGAVGETKLNVATHFIF